MEFELRRYTILDHDNVIAGSRIERDNLLHAPEGVGPSDSRDLDRLRSSRQGIAPVGHLILDVFDNEVLIVISAIGRLGLVTDPIDAAQISAGSDVQIEGSVAV